MFLRQYIYLSILALSFLCSLTVYWRKDGPLFLKLFPPFLLITFVVEYIGYGLHERRANSMLYNSFMIFDFTFYFFVLYQMVRNKYLRKAALYTCWLYPILGMVNLFFIQGMIGFPVYSYVPGALLVIFFCFGYFYELFVKRSVMADIRREPAFWICCGLLFFFGTTLPMWASATFIENFSDAVLSGFHLFLTVVNCIFYSLFTIAFLCHLRFSKPAF